MDRRDIINSELVSLCQSKTEEKKKESNGEVKIIVYKIHVGNRGRGRDAPVLECLAIGSQRKWGRERAVSLLLL